MDYLDTRLQALESGPRRVEQRVAFSAPPLSKATMSVNNFGTAALGGLPTLAPPVRFSNPGGSGNLSATAAGVSIDEFKQVLARCAVLEAEIKELKDSRDDSALEINSKNFLRAGICYVLRTRHPMGQFSRSSGSQG